MEPVRSMDILIDGQRIPDDYDELEDPSSSIISAPRSAPGSRSSSFRNRPRPKLNIDIEAAQRPRTNSLPNAYLPIPEPFIPRESGLYRVRSFKTTSKGWVNHGDSFKQSTNSLKSEGSTNSVHKRKSHHRKSSQDSGGEGHSSSANPNNLYRVLLMGGVGVGKSALARQFMTSEYKGTYAETNTPELVESQRNVNVLLDGEESTLHFLDEEQHPDFEAEDIPIDAYVPIFSVSDITSYNDTVETVRSLRNVHQTNKAIVMVGNKIDLARQRRVSKKDALRVAKKYNCCYIETSAALNHHVDELLVGILAQIREQISPSTDTLAPPQERKHRSRSKSPARAITDFFSRIFSSSDKRAKSCETLLVE